MFDVLQRDESGRVEPAFVVVVDVKEQHFAADVEDGVIRRMSANVLDILDAHRRGAGVDEVELRLIGQLLADVECPGDRELACGPPLWPAPLRRSSRGPPSR